MELVLYFSGEWEFLLSTFWSRAAVRSFTAAMRICTRGVYGMVKLCGIHFTVSQILVVFVNRVHIFLAPAVIYVQANVEISLLMWVSRFCPLVGCGLG